jgi:hypothetical protein
MYPTKNQLIDKSGVIEMSDLLYTTDQTSKAEIKAVSDSL